MCVDGEGGLHVCMCTYCVNIYVGKLRVQVCMYSFYNII